MPSTPRYSAALSITCHWTSISNEEILEAIDFNGKRVCLTGKLRKPRHDYENLLKEAGATIASGISKTTDYLIAGADAGGLHAAYPCMGGEQRG